MTDREFMINTLTDLLENDESLNHPIFGILDQGNTQYFGYFGLTETHLLIALISGKRVTYATRIPLDIKSIKIKQTKIFKQYIIDISFHEGGPCRITASPKVLSMDSQKENLPRFLESLKSKMQSPSLSELKDSKGTKIRWQYFNTFIYMMIALVPMIIAASTVTRLLENRFSVTDMLSLLSTVAITVCIVSAPFIILSVLNRFFFGKIICVAQNDGLLLENDFILWDDMKKIAYTPHVPSRSSVKRYTYATIFVEPHGRTEYSIDVLHFPAYGLWIIKKYKPEIKLELGKSGLYTVLFIVFFPTLISIILSLIM